MTKNVEIEAKNLVTKEQFEQLCHIFSIGPKLFQKQTNYYFDTNDFLLKEKLTALRIREKNEQYELTLKQPLEVGLLETNETITSQEARLMIERHIVPEGEVKRIIQSLIDKEPLQLVGQLVTERAEIYYKGGTLVFDKSTYFNHTDYELEYEGTDEVHVENTFSQLLREHNIERRPAKNKIARLFEYKNENRF